MRPIDADELIKEIDSIESVGKALCKGIDDAIESICATVKDCIIDSPTIDAVPVVRCKDCANHTTAYFGNTVDESEVYCIKDEHNHWNDWFCADGERRTE